MDNAEGMGIFYQERHTEAIHQQQCKEEHLPESVPYLQRGDSSKYLEQFLVKEQAPSPPPKVQNSPPQQPSSHELDEDFSLSSKGKFNPSAFHNFQKHLTICLKHSIEIKLNEETAEEHEKVAVKLWRVFQQSNISTKKVLHFLLGERNQHKITEPGLREFGLDKIYQEAGEIISTEARKYLARQTLKQMAEGKLNSYIENKKLKDKNRFKRYVKIFENELTDGFLRKRLPKDRVNELQNA